MREFTCPARSKKCPSTNGVAKDALTYPFVSVSQVYDKAQDTKDSAGKHINPTEIKREIVWEQTIPADNKQANPSYDASGSDSAGEPLKANLWRCKYIVEADPTFAAANPDGYFEVETELYGFDEFVIINVQENEKFLPFDKSSSDAVPKIIKATSTGKYFFHANQ